MFAKAIKMFMAIALLGLTTYILVYTVKNIGETLNYLISKYQQATKMVFKTGDCTYKRDVFSNFTLQVVNGKVKMDMTLVKILTAGLKAHLSFEFRVSKSKSYQSIFQHDINYCVLLKGSQESLYRRWFLTMLKVGNFATSCPIQTGYYYLRDWHLNGNLIPSFLYLGDYRIGGSFFYGRYRKNSEKLLLECTVEAILV